jgi:hypothetical protein
VKAAVVKKQSFWRQHAGLLILAALLLALAVFFFAPGASH